MYVLLEPLDYKFKNVHVSVLKLNVYVANEQINSLCPLSSPVAQIPKISNHWLYASDLYLARKTYKHLGVIKEQRQKGTEANILENNEQLVYLNCYHIHFFFFFSMCQLEVWWKTDPLT